MQLHTFMLGIDVARRALLLISIPPFQYIRRGKVCAKANNLYPVWGDDTIGNMLGQLCSTLLSFCQLPVKTTRVYCILAIFATQSLRSTLRILQSIDANLAAAGSEFEWRVWPVPYFIAAKCIVYSAATGLCIQAKRCVTRQAEDHLAAAGSKVVATERV